MDKQPIRTVVVKGVRAQIARPQDFGSIFPARLVGHIGRGPELPALEIHHMGGVDFLIRDTVTFHECRVSVAPALEELVLAMKSYLERDLEWKKRLDSIANTNQKRIDNAKD